MQPNLITLDVNDDNDAATPVIQKVYTRFDEYQNRSEYISEDHTIFQRDKVGLYRSFPKQTGNFKGMAKCAIKFTRDTVVAGIDPATSNTVPAIIDIGFSFPVGISAEAALEYRMRAVSMLCNDSIMLPLINQQMI